MRALQPPSKNLRRSVLVVDGTDAIRRLVTINLTARGFDAREAPTLEQAVSLLNDWKPEAVVLEITPRFGNWKLVLSDLENIKGLAGIPVIAFTTELYTLAELQSYNQNVAEILLKPVPVDKLVTVIRSVVTRL